MSPLSCKKIRISSARWAGAVLSVDTRVHKSKGFIVLPIEECKLLLQIAFIPACMDNALMCEIPTAWVETPGATVEEEETTEGRRDRQMVGLVELIEEE